MNKKEKLKEIYSAPEADVLELHERLMQNNQSSLESGEPGEEWGWG